MRNREYKFRAWYNGKMNYGETSCWIRLDGRIQWNGFEMTSKKVKLMQYTGLKDENGKEIYEGDIIKTKSLYYIFHCNLCKARKNAHKYPDEIKLVTFSNGEFCTESESSPIDDEITTNSISSSDEVIGNIYENPELTKRINI